MIFVAVDENRVIGYCAGAINIMPTADAVGLRPVKAGRVFDLYVDEQYRRQRVGLELMNTIQTYFRQLQCKSMYLEVFAPNTKARKFYDKCGFKESTIDLKKSI